MSRQQSRVNECEAREGPEVVVKTGHRKVSPVPALGRQGEKRLGKERPSKKGVGNSKQGMFL